MTRAAHISFHSGALLGIPDSIIGRSVDLG